jgi:hypothetical protein
VKFFNGSPVPMAVIGILAIFLAVWAFLTARNPKSWRQWWMSVLGRTDLNTTREERHRREYRLSIGSYVAFSVFLALGVLSAYFVVANLQEQRQARSDYEQAKEKTMSDFEKMRSDRIFKKL